MRRFVRVGTVMVVFLACFGCSTKKLLIEGGIAPGDRTMQGALVEFVMPEPRLPYMPLIPAGVYRNKILDHKAEIREAHLERVNKFADMLGKAIAEKSGTPFQYGPGLIQSAAYQELAAKGVTVYPAIIGNKHFPDLVMADGNLNFFDFSRVKQTNLLLNVPDYVSENMARVCGALGVDYVAVCSVSAPTNSGSYNGGTRYLQIELYFFDATGKMFLRAFSTSEALAHHPHRINQYEMALDLFESHLSEMLMGIYKQ